MSKLLCKYLILIVGPSASGKSHILNHLTQNGYQRIVSTTTRQMRSGEVDGYDYHFITEDQSKDIDSVKGFVERVDYAGVTYGVTHSEFETKLDKDGVAFLIVEPKGIDKYKEYCQIYGIVPITIYVETHDSIRFERLKQLAFDGVGEYGNLYREQGIDRIIRSAVNEKDWLFLHNYDFILSGTDSVEHNYGIITKIIGELR